MIRAFILAIALCAVASACTYREEKTVVPATTTAAVVAPAPATVTYVDPAPPATVVYTR
jgi:hypothetical protein